MRVRIGAQLEDPVQVLQQADFAIERVVRGCSQLELAMTQITSQFRHELQALQARRGEVLQLLDRLQQQRMQPPP